MSKLETTLQNLPTLVKYGLVIAVILFISTLFPNQNKFPFSFEEGATWNYEDLYAPFNIEIKKSIEELQAEKENLKKEFVPFYSLDQDVLEERKSTLQKAFQLKLELESNSGVYDDVPQNPEKYLQRGFGILHKIYEVNGVIQIATQHQNLPSNTQLKISGANYKERALQNFETPQRALQNTVDGLFQSGLPEAEFMMSLFDESFFLPNVIYDDSLTQQFQNQALSQISTIKEKFPTNDLMIATGEEITKEKFQLLESYRVQSVEEQGTEHYSWTVFLGYFLLTSLIIGVFLFYLQFNAKEIFEKYNWLIFILLWIVAYSYLVYVAESSDTLNAYMIPFCIAPIVLKSFFDERVALFTHIVIILIASFLSSEGYEFTFLQLLAGIVAVLTPIETRDWTKFFYFLLTIFIAYALGFLGLSLIKNIGFAAINYSAYGWIFWSVFLTLLAYPMIPLSERLFGFTSSITLVELSDINRPLLKKLAEQAPGTFQHSLQVGNLAEAAANKINANALLLKTAALYHDIGKMVKPKFFIENQTGKNLHDDLAPEESAQIIIEHISEGIKMAKKNRLPIVLIDFIKTHHGTTRVEYFYKKYKDLNPTQRVVEKDFRYPGPIPTSKEHTILMLADSVEAAAKSLKTPDENAIRDLVNRIIGYKIQMGQLAQSELNFEELEICKKEFIRVLKSIYHNRIDYPDL